MADVTITVLHGADRGKVFRELEPPITIGREEGNTLQLNDERVSRCHLKIQRDNDRLVLTDLDSTNGTKVNGQESQLRILRHGDLISLGRSLLRVGTEEQIAARVASLRGRKQEDQTASREMVVPDENSSALDFEVDQDGVPVLTHLLGEGELPAAPTDLSPGQAAQLCEILEYLHGRLQTLIESAHHHESGHGVSLHGASWQRLLDAQARIGSLIRRIADPTEE